MGMQRRQRPRMTFGGRCRGTSGGNPGTLSEAGELVTSPTSEARSRLIDLPGTPIKEVWLIKEGEGKAVRLEEL